MTSSEDLLCKFVSLLERVTERLNHQASTRPETFRGFEGRNLETLVFEQLCRCAKSTEFENTIELISGQRFPDIVVMRRFGVEVKSTVQNHWHTTGNSIVENTRVPGVERIFLMFGKLHEPIEFKCRSYEECLTEVIVTHSPRYKIDMLAGLEDTIFHKIRKEYDALRSLDRPISPIADYYRGRLKDDEDVWWLGESGEGTTTQMAIRRFANLTRAEKDELMAEAFALFPEILGPSSPAKYRRLVSWLIGKHGLVSPSTRDLFSAGGKVVISTPHGEFSGVPKVFSWLQRVAGSVQTVVEDCSSDDLYQYWGVKVDGGCHLATWLELATSKSEDALVGTGFSVKYLFPRAQ